MPFTGSCKLSGMIGEILHNFSSYYLFFSFISYHSLYFASRHLTYFTVPVEYQLHASSVIPIKPIQILFFKLLLNVSRVCPEVYLCRNSLELLNVQSSVHCYTHTEVGDGPQKSVF